MKRLSILAMTIIMLGIGALALGATSGTTPCGCSQPETSTLETVDLLR